MTTSTFAGSVAAASERCVRARIGSPNPAGRSVDEHRSTRLPINKTRASLTHPGLARAEIRTMPL